MDLKEFKFQYKSFSDINELNEKDIELLDEALSATKSSYSPYSKFAVGAAIRLSNGEIVKGSNQENAAYPSGMCAERVALFAAATLFPGVKIDAIAITVDSHFKGSEMPLAPCGACRQVMIEYEHLNKAPIKVLMHGKEGRVIIVEQSRDLLPFDFQAEYLKK